MKTENNSDQNCKKFQGGQNESAQGQKKPKLTKMIRATKLAQNSQAWIEARMRRYVYLQM